MVKFAAAAGSASTGSASTAKIESKRHRDELTCFSEVVISTSFSVLITLLYFNKIYIIYKIIYVYILRVYTYNNIYNESGYDVSYFSDIPFELQE
jgi:hypothetical protein